MDGNYYNYPDDQQGFGITVIVSLFLHAVFLTALFLLSNGSHPKIFVSPVYTVDLIGHMPAAKPAAVKPVAAKPAEKPVEIPQKPTVAPEETAPKSKPKQTVSKPVQDDNAIALRKKSEQSVNEAIKKIEQQVKRREADETISRAIQQVKDKQVERRIKEIREKVAHKEDIIRPAKGDVGESQAMQTGALVRPAEDQEKRYAQLIGDIIHDRWRYGGDLQKGEATVIAVRIDKAGRLVKTFVEQSSGNAVLDQSAMRAIEKAAPLFPPLPEELRRDFLEIGVCFPNCAR